MLILIQKPDPASLDLESEELNQVLASEPKRASMVSLSNSVHSTGTIAAPGVSVTQLPRRRMAVAGSGLVAGLFSPRVLLLLFSRAESGQENACTSAVGEAMVMKSKPKKREIRLSTEH